MKRILIISDAPFSPSVYGMLSRSLALHLCQNGFSIAVLGFGYSGWPIDDSLTPYPVYPWVGPPGQPQNIEEVLEEFKPDTLLLLGAPILFAWLKNYPNRKDFRVVLHTAFRSRPIIPPLREVMKLADVIVVGSKYEENWITSEFPGMEVTLIPPFIDEKRLQTSTRGEKSENDLFGVACIAYDIPRMDISTLLKAWGIAAKKYERLAFGIFADPAQLMVWNIPDMIDVYGLGNRIIISSNPLVNFGFKTMGDLYQSTDLLVLPWQEEVLNPVALEAAFCGIPMIVPKGGPTEEYLPEDVLFLENTDTFIAPPMNSRYTVFDAEELAEKISEKYKSTIENRIKVKYDSIENVFYAWTAIL